MFYMILVIPNFNELYDFKKSYENPCILSILLEFSWFQNRIFMGFQRVKLRVEFSIWIWYSKIIIDVFKEILSSLWVSRDFMSFQAKYEFMRIYWDYEFWGVMPIFHTLSLRVNYHHSLCDSLKSRDELFLWV